MEKEILTIKDAAKLLKVSPNTVRMYIRKKAIPFHKLGNGRNSPVRIIKEELIEWVLDKDKGDT